MTDDGPMVLTSYVPTCICEDIMACVCVTIRFCFSVIRDNLCFPKRVSLFQACTASRLAEGVSHDQTKQMS